MVNSILRMGNRGPQVVALQDTLNGAGYSLDSDGIYGKKTESAVKDYQKKNGLVVDGIVGKETWGSLDGGSGITTPGFKTGDGKGNTISPLSATEQSRQDVVSQKPGAFSYGDYVQSDTVAQAQALLQQQLAQKPGEYVSQYADQIQGIMDQFLNRDKFSYDLNADALYQQYKDQYALLGQQAMMDTMGQAAAMTGGYGNSYAQSVGQQAYQGYLQQLNDVVPELYQMAYDRYNQEGQDMLNQYGLLSSQDEQEYGRYRDQVGDYYTELERLTDDYRYQAEDEYGKYLDKYNMEYGQHRDSVSDWQTALDRADSEYWNEKNLAYQQERDKVADEQWQKEYEFALKQHNDILLDEPPEEEPPEEEAASTKTNDVPSNIRDKASSFSSNAELADYLDGLTGSGDISEAQADSLYAAYRQADKPALNSREWTRVDDGGINWFGGIDNNATVKDQYGNTYRLDKLVDALVAEGMSKADAKKYVKNLQKRLGA